MKSVIIVFLIVGLAFSMGKVRGQVVWHKCSCNPVMVKENNFYEKLAIGSPDVIYERDTFKMLYAVGGADDKGRINYAFSLNGRQWFKYNNASPVLDVGPSGSWDSFFLDTPTWIKDSVNYKMYYFGDTDNDPRGSAIGMAISEDGIHWHRIQSQPVLTPGNRGDWDGLYIESPEVVFDGSRYFLYYSGIDSTYKVRIGVATSTDGVTWTKYENNPIISEGGLYQWDGFSVGVPTVIYHDGLFEMWYCGVSNYDVLDRKVDTIKVGHATSYDGLHWEKDTNNPVLDTYSPPFSSFELRGPWAPSVNYVQDSGKYFMWYETAYGFGFAFSRAGEVPVDYHVSIYPNPAVDKVTVKVNFDAYIEIYSMTGQKVLSKIKLNKGENEISLTLGTGVYILRIVNGDYTTSRKLVIM